MIGFLADYPNKRDILVLSLLGSLIAYAIVGVSTNLYLLFLSRLVVGLTKQTLTISNVIITEITAKSPENRARELGHISAAITTSFLIGPSVGAYLYKINKVLPIMCSMGCFGFGIIISLLFLPRTIHMSVDKKHSETKVKESTFQHMLHLAKSKQIQGLLLFRGSLFFVEFAINSRSLANYYESKFHIETHLIGYMSSLSSGVSLITQLFLIGPTLRLVHVNESTMIVCCLLASILLALIEGFSTDIYTYLCFSYIPHIFLSSLFSNVLKSHFSSIVPVEDTGKALAVFNLLITTASIVAPLYGAEVFIRLQTADAVRLKAFIAAAHYVFPLSIFIFACWSAPRKSPSTTDLLSADDTTDSSTLDQISESRSSEYEDNKKKN